ncbi:MAG TPA: ROK family protein [Candidatus Binataceae bacterium]|nr:ROK family protein [Candidatus Binataceae bacterium]
MRSGKNTSGQVDPISGGGAVAAQVKQPPAAAQNRSEPASAPAARKGIITLAVDIGGTGIKAAAIDTRGAMIGVRFRIKTPDDATPKKVVATIAKLAAMAGHFDRVSAGFPGVIKDGVVYSAPNLGRRWKNFNLEAALQKKLRRSVRIANDADVQGLGCVSGRGDELVITLGTGFGSVLFVDGHRIHLELGHHPFRKGKTYEDELGHRALNKKGKKKWNRNLRAAIGELAGTFGYDRLYIGGGNARYINFELPKNVKVVSNEEGLLGGIALWREAGAPRGSSVTEALK